MQAGACLKLLPVQHRQEKPLMTSKRSAPPPSSSLPRSSHCGILMSDLRGFTALAELYPPLTLLPLLDHYFATMTGIIAEHGGLIDKFMGDSVLALFDQQQGEDANWRMLSCAVEMQMAMDAVNRFGAERGLPELFMGIGLDAGEIVFCELGSAVYRESTILGAPVNVVSRMSAFALRGQILATQQVLDSCRERVVTGAELSLLLKGKKQVITVHELQGLQGPAFKQVPPRENRRSPRVEAFLPASYHCIERKRVLPTAIKADITDLSYGGMRLVTPQEHHLLDEIKIVVPFALGEQNHSEIYAKVLSCSPAGDDNWCISVEFTWLDEFARRAIRSLVDNLV
jgi:adenylate cyclase